MACLAGTFLSVLVESCSTDKMVNAEMDKAGLVIPVSDFKKADGSFRKYLVLQNEKLRYPVCIYRFSEMEYTALLMECTHQNTELEVFGDKLQCPAHGSEFSDRGIVLNGPADTNLRTFPVKIQNDRIHISLI